MTDPRTLATGTYLAATPAGAYHVVTTAADGPAERLIRAALRSPKPVQLDDGELRRWTGARTSSQAIDVVAEAQAAGWIEGRTDPPTVPDAPLGALLPELLEPLSGSGRAALVDDQGFGLASVGFSAETETELSALSAEMARLRQRRRDLDRPDAPPEASTDGWAVVDRHGASTVAFYPLMAGTQQFVLIVGGTPHLNRPSFVTLVWALSMRYDATPEAGGPTPTPHPPAADPATTPTGGSTHA